MKVNQVLCGDALEIMDSFDINSIDSVVTDGPYNYKFMGAKWDEFTPKGYQEFSFKWGSKSLKVLKPGGYNVSFGAPNKSHRMACGIEDAGFKIQDCLMWLYGSSICHSLDISKAIDSHLGIETSQKKIIAKNPNFRESHLNPTNTVPMVKSREIIGVRKRHGGGKDEEYMGMTKKPEIYITEPFTEEAKQWEGWGTGLAPAYEPIVLAQKPYEKTYAHNILKYGVGALNIDASRVEFTPEKETDSRIYNQEKNITKGKHHKESSYVPIAPDGNEYPMYKTNKGRWPKNVILTHHPECVFIGHKKAGSGKPKHNSEIQRKGIGNNGPFNKVSCGFDVNKGQGLGNFGEESVESYLCHPECPIKLIDSQSGITSTGDIKPYYSKVVDPSCQFREEFFHYNSHKGDKGGASRYFKIIPRFHYSGKAYKTERNAGCEGLYWKKSDGNLKKITKKQYDNLPKDKRAKGNPIKTLKPINLMRYLVRLITPPGGTVLDPFGGSGTTAIACIIEGFNYILIEKRKPFAKIIIPKRLEYWSDPSHWKLLKDHPLLPKIQTKIDEKLNKPKQIDLMNYIEVE